MITPQGAAPSTYDAAIKTSAAIGFMLFLLLPASEAQAHRVADETELIPELIFKITTIREMNLSWVIAKEDKGRRGDVRLSRVIKLEPFAWLARRRVVLDRLAQHLVERGGRDPLDALVDDDHRHFEHLLDPLTELGRNEGQRGIRHEVERFLRLRAVLIHGGSV